MRGFIIAGLAASAALMASVPALAQNYGAQPVYPYDNSNSYNSNTQSYQDYQNALSAYDAARNTAARERDTYDQNSADYRARQRLYQDQLRDYRIRRDAYDDEYGPGAYEYLYPPPAPWN